MDEESLGDAINACLVLAGVRPRACLDMFRLNDLRNSRFMKALGRLQKLSCNIRIVCRFEPFLSSTRT